jgi:hypothetical protein
MPLAGAPQIVDVLGLVVGFVLGIIPGLYLHLVSPFDHGQRAKLGLIGLGTAIVLLSAEPALQLEVLVIGARAISLIILAFLQVFLFARLVMTGPFPTPAQAMMKHLVDADLADADEELNVLQMYWRAFRLDGNGDNGE